MTLDQAARRWTDAFAERTRVDVGSGLASILAMAGATDVISLSGGFPDPSTFPGTALAEILGELIEAGDPSPFQYAATRGLAGTLDHVAGRLEALEG